MVVPVLLLTLGAAAVLFGSRRPRSRRLPADVSAQPSPVAYQHLQLFQGGIIEDAALETAKSELEHKLAQGGAVAVETCLRPGLDYVVKVRALGEIGTSEAGHALERQLIRRISSNPIEQAWYWIDLAQALREVGRGEALPSLFRCSERALETPLGHLFAAEVSAFAEFGDYLDDPLGPLGQAALRNLRSAMEGVRRGFVPITLYAEAQIGEILRRLGETCPDEADPLLARIFLEGMRHARRSYSSSPELRDDPLRRQAIRWQAGHLRDAEPIFREYLHGIGEDLAFKLPQCGEREQREILGVIAELHADAGDYLLGLIEDVSFPWRAEAIECLQWSESPEASYWLHQFLRGGLETSNGNFLRRRLRGPMPASTELVAAFKSLRGHPGETSEMLLVEYAQVPDPIIRAAALRSLGWSEPIDRHEVIGLLNGARIDSDVNIRTAAIAALARLGECAALQVIRDSLTHSNPEIVHQAIDAAASEGLSWLWPDLDMLTEADSPAIAHHAWEAIENLRESILGPLA